MDNNILGHLVRKARGDLSLREFAKKCKISHTHLDSIEKGYDPRTGKPVKISMDTLEKISIATGLSIDCLMGLEPDRAALREAFGPSGVMLVKENLSDDDIKFLQEINQLAPENKEKIRDIVNVYLKSQNASE